MSYIEHWRIKDNIFSCEMSCFEEKLYPRFESVMNIKIIDFCVSYLASNRRYDYDVNLGVEIYREAFIRLSDTNRMRAA